MKIRTVNENDAEELLKIYSYYVKNTVITFEYEVPSVEEFKNRIKHTLIKYPYIAAEDENKIIGYAYAGAFKERAAYDWAVEMTVYVDNDRKRGGVGKLLYKKLEELLKEQGILNVNACIAYTENEDEYLTNGSMKFHEHMGYNLAGHFHKCGYKFNRWYDMIWMEKFIGEHEENQKKIKYFSEL